VTPWIIATDAAGLLDYLAAAFDGQELGRMAGPDGRIEHAEIRIGDSVVMLFDAQPGWPRTPAFLRLFVEDADATHRRAVAAGGESVTDVTLLAFGDRVGRVRDPFGNIWWIQTHVEDVDPDEMQRRWSDPEWTAAMAYVQGAQFFPDAPST
jgi:PhnB protein